MNKIIQIEPWIDDSELKQLERVVKSTFVVEHDLTKEFEASIKKLTGSKYAISITNGTAALYCCLKALNIGPGDEVIVPDLTFIATANAVIMAGAKPILCDVTNDTFCLDSDKIEELINKNTKAIMPVHLYGQSCDMYKINNVAKKHNLFVIEDAAQGVGVKFDNQHVGTFGDLGVLSFYGNKTITCGEGGVILTENEEFAKKCYRLKNHGRDRKGVFVHEHIGFNFCFTEMQAAIGLAQMGKLNLIIDIKKSIHERYVAELSNVDGLQIPFLDERTTPVYWFTSILTDRRDKLIDFLDKKGIQTRLFFYPLHKQPCYNKDIVGINTCKNSLKAFETGVSLPSAYSLTREKQKYIIDCIKDFFSEK
jgi:perosamine synthetase